jgi:hypothetical protein
MRAVQTIAHPPLPAPCLLAILFLFIYPASAVVRADVTEPAIRDSIRRGVDFLLADQNRNGSWGSATRTKAINIYAPLPGAHHAFRAGASSLALCGIIDSADARREVADSIQKAAAWTAAELPKLRRADQTTTYNVWGHAYGLLALSRLHSIEADSNNKSRWTSLAQQQVDLLNRYEEVNGGWGYLDVFDELTTRKPSGMPTSFTTATVLLAMDQARRSMGVELDGKILQRSVTSINRQRTPDFSYSYSFDHRMRPRLPINRPAGSLARTQVCNAALRTMGETAVTDEVIMEWADRFLAREGFLSNGRKRPLPHEAKFQISGYFYYYGIYYFTRSVAHLPASQRAAYAGKIAAILLERQEKDGSWWDYPLYDYHQPYGTGYALMALSWSLAELRQTPNH